MFSQKTSRHAKAALDNKVAFAAHWLHNYRVQQRSGDSLSKYLADNFGGFTEEDFKSADSDTRRNLWDLSRSRGFFVSKSQNVLIAYALLCDAKEHLPWPDEGSKKPGYQATLLSQQKQAEISDLVEVNNNIAIHGHVTLV